MIDSPDGKAGQGVTEEDCDRAGVEFEDRTGETAVAAGVIAGDMAGRIVDVGVAIADFDSPEPEVEDFLVSSDRMMDQITTALQKVPSGKHTLQIPNFSTEDSLRSFIRALNEDRWLKYNAIIVCFFNDGCVTFGISRVEDGDFWQSRKGVKALGDRQINVYTIPEYTEMMTALWQGGIDGVREIGPN